MTVWNVVNELEALHHTQCYHWPNMVNQSHNLNGIALSREKKYLSIASIVMYKSQLKQTKQFLWKWLDFSKRRAPGMSYSV